MVQLGAWGKTSRWAAGIGAVVAGVCCFYPGLRLMWSGPPDSTAAIPAGSAITIRLARPLTSQSVRLGEVFEAWAVSTAVVKGGGRIPSGTRLEGRCVAVRQADGVNRPGYLRLALSGLRNAEGRLVPLETTTLSEWGERAVELGRASMGEVLGAQTSPFPSRGGALPRADNSGEAVVTPQENLTFVLLKPVVISGHFKLP